MHFTETTFTNTFYNVCARCTEILFSKKTLVTVDYILLQISPEPTSFTLHRYKCGLLAGGFIVRRKL